MALALPAEEISAGPATADGCVPQLFALQIAQNLFGRLAFMAQAGALIN